MKRTRVCCVVLLFVLCGAVAVFALSSARSEGAEAMPATTEPAAAGPAPAEGGTPVNGLQVSLAAPTDAYVIGSASLALKVTFTNVTDNPIKLSDRMLFYVPTVTDPDGHLMTPKDDNGPDMNEPTEKDIQTLAPAQSIVFTVDSFPGVFQPYLIRRFDLSRPGQYRLRLTYTAQFHLGLPAAFKECWQGTLTSNEIAIDVRDRNDNPTR